MKPYSSIFIIATAFSIVAVAGVNTTPTEINKLNLLDP